MDTENIIDQQGEKAQSESLKLVRNSKGFTWEVRTLSLDVEKIWKLNDDMQREADLRKGE